MNDERIRERERLQIEQIGELNFDELQVEEVNDNDDLFSFPLCFHTRASGNIGDDELMFNPVLASLHMFLGEVEDTQNRVVFMDGGTVLKIRLFFILKVVMQIKSRWGFRLSLKIHTVGLEFFYFLRPHYPLESFSLVSLEGSKPRRENQSLEV
ncbi:unnamed protein product [Arabidopsis thaliana]|uniref:(thale cress) hypothetical protein n=1 Tax=Arabidopsis thaliana TaxID=3702 RepID=A0A7G2ETR3_ARATH|nr:unnamed protein product [Arabidopsis thaliana]